jgi:hypothetical protein
VAFDGAVYRGASAITEDATLSDPEGLFSFVYLASASHGTPSTIGLTVSHTGYVSASVLVPFQPETSHRVTLTPTRPETH